MLPADDEISAEKRWNDVCVGRCAILHCEKCPDYEKGICIFPDTKKAKEIVEQTRRMMGL